MSQVTFIICSIFPPIKHRILFYLQKKTPIFFLSHYAQTIKFAINCEKSCVCKKNIVLLCRNRFLFLCNQPIRKGVRAE